MTSSYAQVPTYVDSSSVPTTAWLTLRIDEKLESELAEPEDLIEKIKGEKHNNKKDTLQRLGSPNNVIPMVLTRRLSKDYRKSLQKIIELDPDDDGDMFDPEKGRWVKIKKKDRIYVDGVLHQYVSLGYKTEADADAALTKLKKDKSVKIVYKPSKVELSNDPLYTNFQPGSYASDAIDGAWGLHALQMSDLWAISPGHGYVGILDNGTDPNHPDLVHSLRPHKSRNFYDIWARANNVYCVGSDKSSNVDELLGQPEIYVQLASGYRCDPIQPSVWQNRSIGHGTHVHGIIAAARYNVSGSVGVCPQCSVFAGKIRQSIDSPVYASGGVKSPEAVLVNGLRDQILSGVQVINLSLGFRNSNLQVNYSTQCGSGSSGSYNFSGDSTVGGQSVNDAAICSSLALAIQHDVQIVAASGNSAYSTLDFPARDPRVLAVGGTQLSDSRNGSTVQMEFWTESVNLRRSNGSPLQDLWGSSYGANQWLTAPARDVVSTFYRQANWNKLGRCGTVNSFFGTYASPNGTIYGYSSDGLASALNPDLAYGVCTGTSMAAPHISGLVGWYRSLKPLRKVWGDQQTVKTALAEAARIPNYGPGAWDQWWGYGVPQGSVLAANVNGSPEWWDGSRHSITPLFSLQDMYDRDFFFTTVPTMAASAVKGEIMWPQSIPMNYCSFGTQVYYVNPSGVPAFPTEFTSPSRLCITRPDGTRVCTGGGQPAWHNYCGLMLYNGATPKATMSVYTRPNDEWGTPLHALHRFSFVEPSTQTGRHVYGVAPVGQYQSLGFSSVWRYDGVEGYVYPANSIPYINGTVGLHRLRRPPSASEQIAYTLSKDTDLAHWLARGFIDEGRIGWVRP